mgnify:FL=1
MKFAPKEKGQGLVEYALILVLVAIVVILVLGALGQKVGEIFNDVQTTLGSAGSNQVTPRGN